MLSGYHHPYKYPPQTAVLAENPFSTSFSIGSAQADPSLFPSYTGAMQTYAQSTPSAVTSIAMQDSDTAVMMRLLSDTFGAERQRFGIPKDPKLWSRQHVLQWLNWAVREFYIEGVDLSKFAAFDGAAICQLTQQQFLSLCPFGDVLYHHLADLIRGASVGDLLTFDDYFGTTDLALAANFVSELPEIHPDDLDAMNLFDDSSSVSSSSPSSPGIPHQRKTPPRSDKEQAIPTPEQYVRTPSVTSLCSTNSRSSYSGSSADISPLSTPPNSPYPRTPSNAAPSARCSSPTKPDPSTGAEEDFQTGALSPTGSSGGQVQLWQFLLELLTDREAQCCIAWTSNQWEFKLSDPEQVARRWGERKNKPRMNYEKLSRGLRYYYDKKIINKVQGKRYVYKFVCDIESLLGLSWKDLQKFLSKSSSKPFSFSSLAYGGSETSSPGLPGRSRY